MPDDLGVFGVFLENEQKMKKAHLSGFLQNNDITLLLPTQKAIKN